MKQKEYNLGPILKELQFYAAPGQQASVSSLATALN